MCGRFSIHLADLSEIGGPLGVTRSGIEVWEPRFNVAPTQLAPVVYGPPGDRDLALHRFGLVPHWADSPAIGARLINARIETVADKPAFRDAFARRRCIVPATGYFEWQPTGSGRKQPIWLHPGEGQAPLLWLAGLRARWRRASPTSEQGANTSGGETLESFCILTRDATGRVAQVHNRMPVALPHSLVNEWLSGSGSQALLDKVSGASADSSGLELRPVSTLVNSPRNDGPECLAQVEPTQPPTREQLKLF